MKRMLLSGLAAAALLVTACSSGAPKIVVPESSYNFGDVPVVQDMHKDGKHHAFVIENDGTAPLKIASTDVKLLQGC